LKKRSQPDQRSASGAGEKGGPHNQKKIFQNPTMNYNDLLVIAALCAVIVADLYILNRWNDND
jgi:hypothetical protein